MGAAGVVARVRRTIAERRLIAPGSGVLCACSGGPDSAALVVALAQLSTDLGFRLEAASVNHGLRAEAAADVAIAREQALAVGVPFHALEVTIAPGDSLQAAARDARYRALLELAARLGLEHVATGHTLDDQAETVLMRLLRGSGLRGIGGIQPRRADGVIRPLLDCRRADAADLARRSCARVADDGSNRDPRFERVRVRKRLLPALQAEDGAVVEHLAELAEDAREAHAALTEAAGALLPADEEAETIDLSPLAAAPGAIRRAGLAMLLEARVGRAPGRAHLLELERALQRDGAEVWLPDDWVAVGLGGGRIRLLRRSPGEPG